MNMKRQDYRLAKISRPKLRAVLPRERLFTLLDHKLEYPVIWVNGPAGSGKTTFVANYLERREQPCLWYQVDPGDSDIATFFYYLGLAGKKAAPRKKKPLPLFTPEYALGLPTFTRRFFEDLFGRVKTGFVVFDNFQEASGDSRFHEVVREGLAVVPDGVHALIISRAEPPADLARLSARNTMAFIGWDDLRLAPEETHALVERVGHSGYSPAVVEQLHDKTNGWVAGLHLLLKRAEIEDIEPHSMGRHTPEEVFHYFGSEVFEMLPPDIQAFLSTTSVFPSMTPDMARELTGLGRSGEVLSWLNREHYFTDRRVDRDVLYQYHPLFREFLHLRLRKGLTQESRVALFQKAADLLEKGGQTEASVTLLLDAQDWSAGARLILEHAPAMLQQGRMHTLLSWIQGLPKSFLEKCPWLFYWKGFCSIAFDPSASREDFEQAFEQFRDSGDIVGTWLSCSAIVESLFYSFEKLELFDYWYSIMKGLMEDGEAFPSKEIETEVLSALVTALTFRQPGHEDLGPLADRVFQLQRDSRNMRVKAYAFCALIYYYSFMGHYEKGAAIIEVLNEDQPSPESDPLSGILRNSLECLFHCNAGLHRECMKACRAGLKLSEQSGVHIMDHFFLCGAMWSTLTAGDMKTAKELQDQLDACVPMMKPYDRSFYLFVKSQEALNKNDPNLAKVHVDHCMEILDPIGVPINSCLVLLTKTQVLHALGNTRDAWALHKKTDQISNRIKSRILKYTSLLIKAQIHLDHGEGKPGLAALKKALALGRENRFYRSLTDQPHVTARLCARALREGIEPSHVRDMIRIRGLVPQETSMGLEEWPWPLRISTLGNFEIGLDGKPFTPSGRTRQKPLILLKVLIALGGKGVSEARIQDILWPDMDGDAAHNAFSTTLHRLRKIVGQGKAIVMSHEKVSLNPKICWVDAWAFEYCMEMADTAEARKGNSSNTPAPQEYLTRAFALTGGSFLKGESEPWLIPYRERLRSKFLRCVTTLGRMHQAAGRMEEAVLCFDKGLEIDPLVEDFYFHLMLCYREMGQSPEAIRIYQRCKDVLTSSLDVEPSERTKALHQSFL
ncbi:MAG: BTAD domain-containing putative transcriptional regulator [Desulfobacteraceae bacterium]|jgi:ATP/maltotriose-dependent transcriptional regulator MalT/DNA-binding SARP family transcriptional activator